MNSFDVVIYVGLIVAVVTGFKAGLLRSAVTILAYLFAMPIAVSAMSMVSPAVAGKLDSPWAQNSLLFFGIFLVAGIVLGKIMRMALDDAIGAETGIGDRLAGGLQVEIDRAADQLAPAAGDGVGEAVQGGDLCVIELHQDLLARHAWHHAIWTTICPANEP